MGFKPGNKGGGRPRKDNGQPRQLPPSMDIPVRLIMPDGTEADAQLIDIAINGSLAIIVKDIEDGKIDSKGANIILRTLLPYKYPRLFNTESNLTVKEGDFDSSINVFKISQNQ